MSACTVCGLDYGEEGEDLCVACTFLGMIVGDEDPSTGDLILDKPALMLALETFTFDEHDRALRETFGVPASRPSRKKAMRQAYKAARWLRIAGDSFVNACKN
jgi:hypothetical protein